MQNFRAKPDTAMRHADDLDLDEYRAAIAVTRLVLGPKARVQAPPNLVDLAECRALLEAGVDDWGGVSPLTPDHVNPERPWPSLERLRELTAACGFELRARLTVHPEYVRAGEPWLDPRVSAPRGRAGRRRRPRPPRRPPHRPALAGARRRLQPRRAAPTCTPTVDTDGRTEDRRSDFDDVYGDWDAVAEAASPDDRGAASDGALGVLPSGPAARRARAAEADPGNLSDEHALTLMTAEGDLLEQVCRLADDLRRETVGDEVTYVVNRNINFTNVCYVGCRFCAFAQRRTDADAYSLSLDRSPTAPRRRGTSAPPRSACRAASTPSCPAPPTSTSPPR